MDPNRRRMTDSVLNLTLEIMYLLTGEDYTVVKKTTSKPGTPTDQSQGSDGWSRSQSPIMAQSALSPSCSENNDRKVLELANRIIHFLTGEVWQYLLGQKDLVKDVMIENCITDTPEETNNMATWEELGPSSTISTPSDHTDHSFALIKNEPGPLDEDRRTNSDTPTPVEQIQYAAAHIKLETVPGDQGHLAYTEMCSSNNHEESASTSIKEEYASSEEGDPAFYEPTHNGLASYSDKLTDTSNAQIANRNAECLGTCPDFEDSLARMETKTTCMPSMVAISQIPDLDSGICFSDSPSQEGHACSKPFACSKCGKCFGTQSSLFQHERIHIGLGKKGGSCTEAGLGFASTDPAGDQCSDKSPVWTGGGHESGTSTKNGSSPGSNSQTNSCDILEQDSPVQDGGGKKTRTSLNNTTSAIADHQTFSTSGLVDPWKSKKASCVECGEVFPFKSQLVLHQRNHLDDVSYIVFSHLLKSLKIQDLGIQLLNLGQHKGKMAERILNLTLEIIYLLTGKDYELVKMISGKLLPYNSRTSDPSPIMDHPPPSLTSERNNQNQIQEVTQKVIELLTGEVPIRCQDVSVYLSMEEWEYLEVHKDLYKDVMMEDHQTITSPALRSLDGGASIQKIDYSIGCVSEMLMFYNERSHMNERMLQLTLEIIYLLTGENCTVMKKGFHHSILQGNFPPPLPTSDINHDRKILEVIQKMIELLTGEVPIRCQDVSVWFSMEEWEYLEGHKELYKEVVMENQLSLTSPGLLWSWNLLDSQSSISSVEEGHLPNQDGSTSMANNGLQHPKDQDEPHVHDIDGYPPTDDVGGTPHSLEPPTGLGSDSSSSAPQQVGLSLACPLCGKTFTRKAKFSKHVKYHTVERPHSCPECNKSFIRSSDLAKHAIVHTGEKPFPCTECGRCFVSKAYLAIHTRIHTGEKPYSCSECKKRFISISALIVHRKIHTGEKPHICSECGKGFIRKSDLVQHLRVHTGEKPFSCDECGKRFFSKPHLVVHQRVHTGERPFSCVDCGKCFSSKTHLVVHRRIHTGDRPYPCPECGKCFIRKAVLVLHQRSHAGEKPYSCAECGRCFAYKTYLSSHRKIHLGMKPFPCPDCGKCFISNSEVVKHRRTHTGERPHFCSECGKCFTKKSHLNRHQKIHSGDKPHSCNWCSKSFIDNSDLVKHQLTHTRDKTCSCPECGKSFLNNAHLVLHSRVHHGGGQYPCPECGKCFPNPALLLNHQRSHTDEKPFICSECGKSFARNMDLVKHVRSHTGEKPYSCSECGRSFAEKSYLHIHQRTHTGERPYPCPLCGKCFISNSDLAKHVRIHTGERPHACTQCGKRFIKKSHLTRHQKVHVDDAD